jgi:hypothetical protein
VIAPLGDKNMRDTPATQPGAQRSALGQGHGKSLLKRRPAAGRQPVALRRQNLGVLLIGFDVTAGLHQHQGLRIALFEIPPLPA